MTTRSSGRARERSVVRLLESKGWIARLYPLGAKFIGPGRVRSQRLDVFGCDVEAVRSGVPYTLRIQVKTQANVSKGKKQVEAAWRTIYDMGTAVGQQVEVWAWGRWKRDGVGFAFRRYVYGGGTSWAFGGYEKLRGDPPSPASNAHRIGIANLD